MTIPKTLRPFADKIAEVEDARDSQNGWWVYFVHGWKSYSDPMGCLHQCHADTLAECATELRYALPCDCEDCLKPWKDAAGIWHNLEL